MENIFHMNSNEKKAQVAIVIADEIDEMNSNKDKEGLFHNDRRVHNYNNRATNTWSKM